MASQRLDIKYVPGTDFVVDGFRFQSPRACAYFLTHFHSDHTTGLTKAYSGPPIYCSPITGDLLVHDMGLPEAKVQRMALDMPFTLHGVEVTLLDAQHCPGAVLILFKVPRSLYVHVSRHPGSHARFAAQVLCRPDPQQAAALGASRTWLAAAAEGAAQTAVKGLLSFFGPLSSSSHPAPPASPSPSKKEDRLHILHTGDFRWSPSMALYPALRNLPLHCIMLDTTYADPKYCFPPREEAVSMTVRVVQDFLRSDPGGMVVIGSYHIGKEMAYLGAADRLNLRVYVDDEKLRVLRLLGLPGNYTRCLTKNPKEATIFVAWMGQVRADALRERLEDPARNPRGARTVLGVRPTGWSYRPGGALDRKQQGPVCVVSVPYSEHSSFDELRDCIRTLRPQRIIPTVNAGTAEKAKALVDLLKPKPSSVISSFFPRLNPPAPAPPAARPSEDRPRPTALLPGSPDQDAGGEEGGQRGGVGPGSRGDRDKDYGSEPEEEREDFGTQLTLSQTSPPAPPAGLSCYQALQLELNQRLEGHRAQLEGGRAATPLAPSLGKASGPGSAEDGGRQDPAPAGLLPEHSDDAPVCGEDEDWGLPVGQDDDQWMGYEGEGRAEGRGDAGPSGEGAGGADTTVDLASVDIMEQYRLLKWIETDKKRKDAATEGGAKGKRRRGQSPRGASSNGKIADSSAKRKAPAPDLLSFFGQGTGASEKKR